jgi:hypothetical protein
MLKLNDYNLDVKLENKDLLLARVWHRDRVYLIKPCMLGVGCLWSY